MIESDGAPDTFMGKQPEQLFSHEALGAKATLEISFAITLGGEAAKPQQVMVMVASPKTGAAAYAVAKAKKSIYTITVTLASLEKQIGSVAGDVDVALLVGDPTALPLRWDLGTLKLQPAGNASPAKVLTAATMPVVHNKPIITHIFRQPDKRAPAVVSLTFTGLALAPLLLLLLGAGMLQVNFKAFPCGSTGVFALMFHGGLAAQLGLYYLFWTQLNLVQTLPLALALGAFLAVTGYKTLSGLASSRIAAAKKAE